MPDAVGIMQICWPKVVKYRPRAADNAMQEISREPVKGILCTESLLATNQSYISCNIVLKCIETTIVTVIFYYYHYHLRYHYRCHHCYHDRLMLCAICHYMYRRRRSRNDCFTIAITINCAERGQYFHRRKFSLEQPHIRVRILQWPTVRQKLKRDVQCMCLSFAIRTMHDLHRTYGEGKTHKFVFNYRPQPYSIFTAKIALRSPKHTKIS